MGCCLCCKFNHVLQLKNKYSGGGFYDEFGMKNGQWIELEYEWRMYIVK